MSASHTDVRVLVVEDDPVFRHILSKTFARIPGTVVVGMAPTLAIARSCLDVGDVDLVTLDVVMKGESGLDLLAWMRQHHPTVVAALLTAGTTSDAREAADALWLGASTLLLKPSGPRAQQELLEALTHVVEGVRQRGSRVPLPPASLLSAHAARSERELIAIGASAGGPGVVKDLISGLPASFRVPILVVQHMPAVHVPYFREVLARATTRNVQLAQHGARVEPDTVYLAGDGKHLTVGRQQGRLIQLQDDGPEEHYCRPAVDPLFRSIAAVCGASSLGVVVSGMGADGARGAQALRARGATIIVQDRESSVVWGMPGAVVEAGAASEIAPASELAACVLRCTSAWKRSYGDDAG